jgi:hypothetical protein
MLDGVLRLLGRGLVGVILVGLCVKPAPATIAEQRARLPPPAECSDPIVGTWRGLSWYPNHLQWYEFTLEVKRVPGDDEKLTGTIFVHYWDGPIDNHEPPSPCRGQRVKIHQPAEGFYRDGQVQFGGTSVINDEVICGGFSGEYWVDVFKGKVDTDINEFNSVNDWNSSDFDEPTVFRRIKCTDESPLREQKGDVTPPAFYPKAKKSTGGC